MAKNIKDRIVVIDNIIYKRLDNALIDVLYNISFYKHSSLIEKNIYICDLIFNERLKISNYKYIYIAQEAALEELINKDKTINSDNSILYTFFTFSKGLRLSPDIGMFKNSSNFKKKIDESKKIAMGGTISIMNTQFLKNIKILTWAVNYFGRNTNSLITDSKEKAYELIKEFQYKNFNENN